MGNAGEVIVFLTDNALGAALGVVWCFCLPMYEGSPLTAYRSGLLNDALGTAILAAVAYMTVSRFGADAGAVDGGKGSPGGWLSGGFSTELHVTLARSFALASGCLHTKVALDQWYVLAGYITGHQSSYGDCVSGFEGAEVGCALALACVTALLYGFLAFAAYEQRDTCQDDRALRTVWDLIAGSFSFAVGWSVFAITDRAVDCLPGQMASYLGTQVVRAVVVVLVCAPVYAYVVPVWLVSARPMRSNDMLAWLLQDAVHTLVSLALFSIYYVPLHDLAPTSEATNSVYIIAALVTVAVSIAVYWGILRSGTFGESAESPNLGPMKAGRFGFGRDVADEPAWTRNQLLLELAYHVASRMVMFAWFYPLSDALETVYQQQPRKFVFLSILGALATTVGVALLVTASSLTEVGATAMSKALPAWAKRTGGKADATDDPNEETKLLYLDDLDDMRR